MTFLIALFLLQAPGDGWGIAPAPPREVRRVYWDLFETTEVWVLLLPEGPQGERPLVNFVFQAFFPGRAKREPYSKVPRWPKGKPEQVVLKVQGTPLTVIRELSLRLVIDNTTVDLTGPGSDFRSLGCFAGDMECSPTGVEVKMEPSLLQSMITAERVRAQALGFPIELGEADQLALAAFAERVGLSGKKESK